MNFSKGYTASFYGTIVNPETWADGDRFEIVDGTISRSSEDIRQNASITVLDIEDLADSWIRIYMDATQNGDNEHVPLFTGLASSPKSNFNNGVMSYSLDCYSVLKAISDILLPIGWYAPANGNGVDQIVKLLKSEGINVPIEILPEGVDYSQKILKSAIIAESNETHLTMIDAILDAIEWEIEIEGDGTIELMPFPNPRKGDIPVTTLSKDYDVLETSFSVSNDWFDCPNIVRVISGDATAIAKDDDPDSPYSIKSRGREIWLSEDSPSISEDKSIAEYAKDLLRKEQNKNIELEYTRRYLPEINQGDYIKINYPQIKGDFYVESQNITLGPAAKTNETLYSFK